jgi:hypothetical protein
VVGRAQADRPRVPGGQLRRPGRGTGRLNRGGPGFYGRPGSSKSSEARTRIRLSR